MHTHISLPRCGEATWSSPFTDEQREQGVGAAEMCEAEIGGGRQIIVCSTGTKVGKTSLQLLW